MRPLPIAGAGVVTAAIMAVVGWGLPGLAMAGPRAGARIAALVPQAEVAVLFFVGLPLWAASLRAEGSPALRRALAATARGPLRAVGRAAALQGKGAGMLLAGGAAAWLLAVPLAGGPSLREVAGVRLLLAAFAVFGIGLGIWSSAAWRGSRGAVGFCLLVSLAMAAIPLGVAPLIAALGARPALIQASMLLSPWVVAAGASGLDLLRMQWAYALSPLGSLDAPYPGLGAAVALYAGAGLILLILSARALRSPGRADDGGYG